MTQDNIRELFKAKKLLLNSAPLFTIFDKAGQQKPWIKRGFLSSKWLGKKDLDRGWLEMDGKPYQLSCTQALFYAIAGAKEGDKIKAICSFQEHACGNRLVIAKVLDKEPLVIGGQDVA